MDCQVRRAAHLRAVNARHQGNGNHRYCKSIRILSYKSTYLCMYAYIRICICICRCRCICVYVNICISVYLYICIYVSMNICIYAIPYDYITFHIILTRTGLTLSGITGASPRATCGGDSAVAALASNRNEVGYTVIYRPK